jgi:hypothetical protein
VPAGRYPKSFGYSHVMRVSYVVSVSSLRKYRKKDAVALTRSQIKDMRKHLRVAFWIYQTDHKEPHSTRTTHTQLIGRAKNLAQRFLETPSRLWASRLLGCLNQASDDDRKALYEALYGIDGIAIPRMKRGLEHLHPPPLPGSYDGEVEISSVILAVSRGQYSRIPPGVVHQSTMDRIHAFVTEHFPVVRAIADIDLSVPRVSGRWPNPALAMLVSGLAPIWEVVTERTRGLTSVDRTANEKQSLFTIWLTDILDRANLPRASLEQVIGIVRDRKS